MPARSIPAAGQMELSLSWSPGRPPVGVTTTFTATASDNDGAVRSARLCYGDGTPCDEEVRLLTTAQLVNACVFGDNWGPRQWSHKFTKSGAYPVTLTVTTRGCPGFPDETRSLTTTVTVG